MSSHPPNDSESAFSLRPSAPSIIRRVRCPHIPPMIRNRPSAFGRQPSAIQTSDISLRPSAFGHRHLPSFGACDVFTSPNDSESAFHLRPFSLRTSAPSIIRRVRCLHIPPMTRNRPSSFGHQPSAIGTIHHSARPMSSHSPLFQCPSAEPFGTPTRSLRPSAPSIIRRVRCLHIPPMIRNRPSAFGHQPSAFNLRPSAFGHRHLPTFGASDVFTSPQ
ncbi:unnamed protein product [Prunus armeniaca]